MGLAEEIVENEKVVEKELEEASAALAETQEQQAKPEEKPEEKPAVEEKPGEPAEKPPEKPDVEKLLAEAEKGPGGMPRGAIADLQEERAARHAAERRAEELDRRIAALEQGTTASTFNKPTTIREMIKAGRLSADDPVTAEIQAELEENRAEKARFDQANQERAQAVAGERLGQAAKDQEGQLKAVLAEDKVGEKLSYDYVTWRGGKLLSQGDKAAILEAIKSGGNGAVEGYRRCARRIAAVDPEFRKLFAKGPLKPAVNKPKAGTDDEEIDKLGQVDLLAKQDLDSFIARQIG